DFSDKSHHSKGAEPMTTALTTPPTSDQFVLLIKKETLIAAPLAAAWAAMLEEIGPACVMPDGTPMNFKLEPWPGGRYYRDLGNNTGHFWAHVQVIKPPTLL